MVVSVNGRSLTVDEAFRVVNGERVSPHSASLKRMAKFRALMEEKVHKGEVVYGVNTGFGSLADERIRTSDIRKLQLNLIRSHAAGVGKPMPSEVVQIAMLIRLNNLLNGNSAVRPEVAEMLAAMLNKRIVPNVPEFGSLGASGDLAPSAHMALSMVGEGLAQYKGKLIPASRALSLAGLKPIELHAKSGLSLINGTCFSASLSCVAVRYGRNLLDSANAAVAIASEALGACTQSFDPRLIGMKKDRGQEVVAKKISDIVNGSGRLRSFPVPQDPYSVRCAPQVHGATLDSLEFVERLTVDEMNSVSDNPVMMEDGDVLHGGNFHAQPVAMCLDLLAITLSYLGVISLARTGLLLSHSPQNRRYMAQDPGLESGLMILQYTATALAAENSKEGTPVSAYPANVSSGVEDHASHGVSAGLKTLSVARNVSKILAIEMICSSNLIGSDFSGVSPGGRTLCELVRRSSPLLKGDRSMSDEVEALAARVISGELA